MPGNWWKKRECLKKEFNEFTRYKVFDLRSTKVVCNNKIIFGEVL